MKDGGIALEADEADGAEKVSPRVHIATLPLNCCPSTDIQCCFRFRSREYTLNDLLADMEQGLDDMGQPCPHAMHTTHSSGPTNKASIQFGVE